MNKKLEAILQTISKQEVDIEQPPGPSPEKKEIYYVISREIRQSIHEILAQSVEPKVVTASGKPILMEPELASAFREWLALQADEAIRSALEKMGDFPLGAIFTRQEISKITGIPWSAFKVRLKKIQAAPFFLQMSYTRPLSLRLIFVEGVKKTPTAKKLTGEVIFSNQKLKSLFFVWVRSFPLQLKPMLIAMARFPLGTKFTGQELAHLTSMPYEKLMALMRENKEALKLNKPFHVQRQRNGMKLTFRLTFEET